jgi:hypothetical protein
MTICFICHFTAKGRNNAELREKFVLAEGVSQAMAPFKSKPVDSSEPYYSRRSSQDETGLTPEVTGRSSISGGGGSGGTSGVGGHSTPSSFSHSYQQQQHSLRPPSVVIPTLSYPATQYSSIPSPHQRNQTRSPVITPSSNYRKTTG